MALSLDATMPFGKYKGTVVRDMLIKDPQYCCWLRESQKKEGKPMTFDFDANAAIDEAIKGNAPLRRKYVVWNLVKNAVEQSIKKAVEAHEVAKEHFTSRNDAYGDSWGAW